jgi:hypothetical protein
MKKRKKLNSESMQHQDAIACFGGAYCLQICLEGLEPLTYQYKERIPDRDFSTWLVRGAQLFTLLQTPEGTRLYDHQTDFLHYAGADIMIPRGTLENHAFLCQSVRDDGEVPRLLIFDLVTPRIENPVERHAVLLRCQAQLPTCCHVQWAGETDALRRFLASNTLPHAVECIASLNKPLVLVKEGTPPCVSEEVMRITRQSEAPRPPTPRRGGF